MKHTKGVLIGSGATVAVLVGGFSAAAIANAQNAPEVPEVVVTSEATPASSPAPTEEPVVEETTAPDPAATGDTDTEEQPVTTEPGTDAGTTTPAPDTQAPVEQQPAPAPEQPAAQEPVVVNPPAPPAPPAMDASAGSDGMVGNGQPLVPGQAPTPTNGYSDEHGVWHPAP